MGLSSDHLWAFLWLLLFQWPADGSAVSTHLLGRPHYTHSSPFPHKQCKKIEMNPKQSVCPHAFRTFFFVALKSSEQFWIYEWAFLSRKKLTTREVTKMKRMSQKMRRRTKMIKSTQRKMGRCRTATRFTTTITARLSEHRQTIWEGLISISQGAGGVGQTGKGWEGDRHSSKPRTAGIMKKFDTVTLSQHRNTRTHIGWLVVRAQRSNRTVSPEITDMAAVALSPKKKHPATALAGEKRVRTRGRQCCFFSSFPCCVP